MVERWSEWATEIVESWPDDLAAVEPDWATLRSMAEVMEAHAEVTPPM